MMAQTMRCFWRARFWDVPTYISVVPRNGGGENFCDWNFRQFYETFESFSRLFSKVSTKVWHD